MFLSMCSKAILKSFMLLPIFQYRHCKEFNVVVHVSLKTS